MSLHGAAMALPCFVGTTGRSDLDGTGEMESVRKAYRGLGLMLAIARGPALVAGTLTVALLGAAWAAFKLAGY